MRITITTWNLQNFARSQPVFDEKLNLLFGTLQALGPDVVALQEILDLNALQDLANGLGFVLRKDMTTTHHRQIFRLVRTAGLHYTPF